MSDELPYAHGGPPLAGVLRACPEDFVVDEDLGFAPSGSGEHVFLRVEKRGANTQWVARELARFAGVGPVAVSYAGLKDRHAITRQTFCVHLPGKRDPEWSALQHPEFRILEVARHERKLKRGALKGNFFEIVLRDVGGEHAVAEQRLAAIRASGVPNYFGEQRFGRGGDNVEQARAMFAGRRVQRDLRGLLLSAARAQIFNSVLAARVEAGTWSQAVNGEVWMLAGSHSFFGPEPFTDALAERLLRGDIHPTGPLWGRGSLRSTAQVAELEHAIAARAPDLAAGLESHGLIQERRELRLLPQNLATEALPGGHLKLTFHLSAGSYATVIIREILTTSTSPSAPADEAMRIAQ